MFTFSMYLLAWTNTETLSANSPPFALMNETLFLRTMFLSEVSFVKTAIAIINARRIIGKIQLVLTVISTLSPGLIWFFQV